MNTNVVNKYSKLEERKFRHDVETFLKEAEQISIPSERIEELREILSYFEGGVALDLKERVEKAISDAKIEMKDSLTEAKAIAETFGTKKAEDLKQGIERLVTDTQLFERQASDWMKIASGLQTKVKSLQEELAARPTKENLDASDKKVAKLKKVALQREKILQNRVDALRAALQEEASLEEKMTAEMSALQDAINLHRKKITELQKVILSQEKSLKEREVALAEQETLYTEMVEKYTAPPKIALSPAKKVKSALDFTQKSDIDSYYEDLESRHGEDIRPFKEKITSCKTLFEAMQMYTKVLTDLHRVINVSEALEPEERKRLLEEQTDTKIRSQSTFESRLKKMGFE